MEDEWAQRARSFGQVAELYEKWRPGYPEALYTDVLTLGPGGRVLEAGAGTGRATLALAQRGASVVAVEPDSAMAALARQRTRGFAVQVQESTFEDCAVQPGSFDLVVSAQAWHWVERDGGAAVAARALRGGPDRHDQHGGALCVWWNRPRDLDGPVWDAIHAACVEYAPALDRRAQLHQLSNPADEDPAPGFTPWSVRTYDWTADYDTESYSGLVQTQSDYLMLPPPQRQRLVEAIREAITRRGGGRLEYRYRTVLLTARVQ